jgi:hypothetical protein
VTAVVMRAPLPPARFAEIRDQALVAGAPTAYVLALDDDRVRTQLALLRAEYAELLAHARAAVAAARDGEVDPLVHLSGYLEEHGLLPAERQHAPELLGQAYARAVDAFELAEGAS